MDKKTNSTSREKIIDMALATLRKKRAEMDPKILNKIREKIFGNPAVMKALGVDQADKPTDKPIETKKAAPVVEPEIEPLDVKGVKLSEDEKNLLGHVQAIMKKQMAQENAKQGSSGQGSSGSGRMEKIDREKNLETISKLMKIRPDYKQ